MLSRRRFMLSSGAVLATSPVLADTSPSDGAVAASLVQTMADQQTYPASGMVAGMLDAQGQRIVTQGTSDAASGRVLDGDTVFDIGSITKLFTALMLADNVVRGQMAMRDPLAKYLPPDVHVPDFQGQPITLLDLVTYSPGLPGAPGDMPKLGPAPFPEYSTERLYQALAKVTLAAAPGTHYVYSNFGYGLLGLALARHAGMDFESLVISRICRPLGMESTSIKPTAAMQARISPGHFKKLAKVEGWNIPPAFAGAGAFRSTANDLLKFLAEAMGSKPSPLAPAFAQMLKTERPSDKPGTQVAAGWFITSAHEDRLIWKDGGVWGYSSFLGYSAVHRNGVVVLANGITDRDALNLGRHLLNAEFSLQG
jgi:D-alanyl-D-alanine-carboxypeptidase/D-alanyl-D-alanine-endopeptidase